MTNPDPARRLRDHIGLALPGPVPFERGARIEGDGFTRETLRYCGLEGDPITAFLFTPSHGEPTGGVVVFHQHAGQFHWGKSEVGGEVGDPLQAFGPALAARGVTVLAPDAITFEDRRAHTNGTEPDEGEADWLQHFNAMAYRLIAGDVVTRKCLDDAQRALSVLLAQPLVDQTRSGVLGHSYGGTTALYHAALDERCRFAAVSGALCSFAERQRSGTGINMFEIVPGIRTLLEARDLVRATQPRPLLVVSASDDPYSADADRVVADAGSSHVSEIRVQGTHALDPLRFNGILDWVVASAAG